MTATARRAIKRGSRSLRLGSAAVLQAVGGGIHRVLFNAAPGVSGYYRVLLWWPQVRGAADVVVDGLNGRAATRVDPGLRSGQWVAAGVFALPADHAQIEVSAPAGMRLFVDALRLQYVGDAPPPPCFGVTAIPVAIAGVQYAAVLEIVDGTPPLAFPVSAVNNGERKGAVWGSGGGWNDATANAYPDDVQIDFNGSKTIDRVVVYTLQDNYSSPMEPTDTLMFSAYGVTAFTVEGWNGSGWTVLGSVSNNNNLVKRTVTFAPYSTNAIRIRVTQGLAQFSRLVEVEAWSVPEP